MRAILMRSAAAAATIALLTLGVTPAAAQVTQPPVLPKTRVAIPPSGPAQAMVPMANADANADQTRELLIQLLEKYPPSLGRVLKLDPSLLSNADYLAPFPVLATFLSQHPDVAHNPAYYLERIRIGNDFRDDRTDSLRMWTILLDWMGGLTIATIIASSLGWLVRLLVDYRRWYRLSKVQAEAHNKLLDRMTANEELLAYVQSTAGSRFLESAPIALDPGSRRIGAPFGRILWSVQAGLVLAAAGLGLQYVSNRVVGDASQPVYVLGVLAVALGGGFILSAIVSYALSKRLGLLETPAGQAEPVGSAK